MTDKKLNRGVAVVGAGMSRFGAFPGKATRDLFVEAFLEMRKSVDRGLDPQDIEALYIGNYSSDLFEGQGHTALTNVEAFSGGNGALTTVPENQSWDYLLVRGNQKLTVSVFGSRMRNYVSDQPFTVRNERAVIQAVACIDKHEALFNTVLPGP